MHDPASTATDYGMQRAICEMLRSVLEPGGGSRRVLARSLGDVNFTARLFSALSLPVEDVVTLFEVSAPRPHMTHSSFPARRFNIVRTAAHACFSTWLAQILI